jgi:hypothetical protein
MDGMMSTGLLYTRHQRVNDSLQKMGPLEPKSWLVLRAVDCPGCQLPFMDGDYLTLVPLGPGGDMDERDRAASGRAFNAVAIAVHWTCATGEPV